MRRACVALFAAMIMLFFVAPTDVFACTNILVTKGASKDGSTMVTYAVDSHELYGELIHTPPGIHGPGEMRVILDGDSREYHGRIPQAPVTYSVIGYINEFQLALAETTFGGRDELAEEHSGIIDYGSLMSIALERAKTAREAIKVMADLVEQYGYYSSGESISISDPNEVWLFEIIGKGATGEGKNKVPNKGGLWVARRIPDGYISAHANQARIRQFPLNDPQNCLYAKDVITFARERGWFTGKDEDFSFTDTYAPPDFGSLRACEARVWSVFRRIAPSQNIPIDFVKGVEGAKPMPLWVKPDEKVSVHDVMQLMRDHYEGTEFDMTKDVGAGPFACPYRWRPMVWGVNKDDEQKYVNERAISTQQTAMSFVTQSRSYLPDPIGGIIWFGFDDSYTTVYVPMYCGMREVPKSFAVGTCNFNSFCWDSGFWVFNFVANWAYSRYSDMIQDIQPVQWELEGKFLSEQPAVEKEALRLYNATPMAARDYLTQYSVKQGDMTVERWKKLGEFLIWKYLDGNVRDSQGHVTHPRYPDSWYQQIVRDHGEVIKVPPKKNPQ